MSRKLNSLSATYAFAMLVLAASSAMSQARGNTTQVRASTAKVAVVAIKREGKLQLAGDKDRLIGAMQRALNSGKEPGVVRDVSISSFEKVSYLTVRIEKQGTLYLQLIPSEGGIQEIYYVGDLNSLYCSGGCTTCNLVPASLSQGTGPRCECAPGNQGLTTECSLFPRRNISQLTQQFNGELLAIGFEVADGGASANENPRVVNGTTRSVEVSPRTNPIKRPKN